MFNIPFDVKELRKSEKVLNEIDSTKIKRTIESKFDSSYTLINYNTIILKLT